MTDEKEEEAPEKKAGLQSRFYRVERPVPAEVNTRFLLRLEIDKGIEYQDKLIAEDPKFEDAWATKGYFYSVVGRYEEAIVACDKALEINPKSEKANDVWQTAIDAFNKKKRSGGSQ